MSKISGTNKVHRTCGIEGREGRFATIRKGVNTTKVRPLGSDNPDDEFDVETKLIHDERIAPRPTRTPTKTTAETKTYPADKQPRRVCFVAGGGQAKFH